LRHTPKLSIATNTPLPQKAQQNGAPEPPETAKIKSPIRRRKSIEEAAPSEEALSQAMLEIESLLTSFDWTHPTPCATRVESMLSDELESVEAENVHSLVMNDGPHMVEFMSRIDDGIRECEELDEMLTLYLVELQSLAEDVNLIESDNRGLHIRTANERALEKELSDLLSSVSISPREFEAIKQENLEKIDGIERVQQGLLKLYRALKSTSGLVDQDDEGPKGSMQIVREMRRMTRQESDKFIDRLKEFVKVKFQVNSR
jgi:exocyst complex component 1